MFDRVDTHWSRRRERVDATERAGLDVNLSVVVDSEKSEFVE